MELTENQTRLLDRELEEKHKDLGERGAQGVELLLDWISMESALEGKEIDLAITA